MTPTPDGSISYINFDQDNKKSKSQGMGWTECRYLRSSACTADLVFS